jgi:hypothetical protein
MMQFLGLAFQSKNHAPWPTQIEDCQVMMMLF